MALSDGVQKDIAMSKMQCVLHKRIHAMYFQYAKIMRIFQKYTWQTGASGNINPMNKKIIEVFSALKHVEADIVGSSSGSGIFNSGNEITVTVTVVSEVHIWCSMFCCSPCMSLLVAHLLSYKGLNLIMWHYKQTRNWWTFFLTHNILKLLFIEIHKFKKKKILEEDEDESNDQQSDAEATGNEGNLNNCLICFSSMVQKLQSPTWRLHSIPEQPHWSHISTCSKSGKISEINKKMINVFSAF